MINKQNLWFLTLFSLIIVLSVYYVTMKSNPDLTALVNNEVDNGKTSVEINNADILVALRVEADEEVLESMQNLQSILLNASSSVEEKNNAYDELMMLNQNKGKEHEIEQKIKELFSLDAFVRIKNDQISIVVKSETLSAEKANEIIKSVQDLYETKMYITVKFQT